MKLLDLKLNHYSGEPSMVMEPREQTDELGMKPHGLWVSVEGGNPDWPEWCLAESFYRGDDLRFQHRVTLDVHHKVLHLKDIGGLYWLQAKYPDQSRMSKLMDMDTPVRSQQILSSIRLDWKRMAEDYHGLVISPYIWEARMDLMWYYSWDCASGCIWNPASVASVEMVAKTDLPDRILAAVVEQDREQDEHWAAHPPTNEADRRLLESVHRLRQMRGPRGKR